MEEASLEMALHFPNVLATSENNVATTKKTQTNNKQKTQSLAKSCLSPGEVLTSLNDPWATWNQGKTAVVTSSVRFTSSCKNFP